MQVRAATRDDTQFLVRLACEAYRDVVTRQFGGWNEREQAAHFAAKAARLPFEVGELGDRPIAAVSASVHPDHVFLNELLVLPEFQNRGFGSELLGREIRRAAQLGLPLRLHTLRQNRASQLFERHGLIVTARGEVFIDMERTGSSSAAGLAFSPAGPALRPDLLQACSRVQVPSEEVRVIVRPETDRDVDGIREVNIAAFQGQPYSQQTEHLIVEALRAAGALEVSLVAESDGEVVGHIAFSPSGIGSSSTGWFLLGPVAVRPDRQGQGIGRALVEAGLDALRSRGARGCVLVGDPAFYGRFGFEQRPGVVWPGVPDENVLCLLMSGEMPTGEVAYHPAFLAGT